ncbi:MAG: hypothetical protein MPK62_03020 [Alphaproteobacteria bacterium]|nr:hypothetical protein [Alphaproteobacteria bacterium]MDA8030101.1 hypothetical protein [Alphaproteobacteria bacterium]
MASRPVFLPAAEPDHRVTVMPVDFAWNAGFSVAQKKKNVSALHRAAAKKGLKPLLEISTKSDEQLGRRLSAFSLKIETPEGEEISLEAAYQGSKVFAEGGPHTDIYEMDARSAKRDPRIRGEKTLTHFDFFGEKWPLTPQTAFYDWLYLTCLRPHREFLLERLSGYKGFTDIEFNPKKSLNCQARACALLVSLLKSDALDGALRSKRAFLHTLASDVFHRDRDRKLGEKPRKTLGMS